MKPVFPDNTKSAVSITLKYNNKIVESQNEVANIFNNYFWKIVSSLQIPESHRPAVGEDVFSYIKISNGIQKTTLALQQ